MKIVWQLATVVGLLAIVLGIVEHFIILTRGEGMLFGVGTPEAFLQFAMAMFLFAAVMLLAGIAQRMPADST